MIDGMLCAMFMVRCLVFVESHSWSSDAHLFTMRYFLLCLFSAKISLQQWLQSMLDNELHLLCAHCARSNLRYVNQNAHKLRVSTRHLRFALIRKKKRVIRNHPRFMQQLHCIYSYKWVKNSAITKNMQFSTHPKYLSWKLQICSLLLNENIAMDSLGSYFRLNLILYTFSFVISSVVNSVRVHRQVILKVSVHCPLIQREKNQFFQQAALGGFMRWHTIMYICAVNPSLSKKTPNRNHYYWIANKINPWVIFM